MEKISLELIQQLREKTGVGMMDCKKALYETKGNIEEAVDLLRKKGAKVAEKRADIATNHGRIHAYIHPGARLGVLVEIVCETDFSANTETMAQFTQDLCMQIAAARPLCVAPADLDMTLINKEKEIYRAQLLEGGKPAHLVDKIAEDKVKKYYEEVCLLEQPFIKNDKLKIKDYLNEMIAKIGENIKIRRFARFEIGN